MSPFEASNAAYLRYHGSSCSLLDSSIQETSGLVLSSEEIKEKNKTDKIVSIG